MLPDLLPQIDQELARRAEQSLSNYIFLMWEYMDPAQFIDNWHIHAITEHLEAVVNNEIRHLIITIPPRCMKSLSVAVALPSWVWGPKNKPQVKFLFASYAASLSIRDSVKCRRLIQSPLYQSFWGKRFQLEGDQNAKQRYDNDKGGYRIASSVDGANTGEGGDIIVIDDPHNIKEAESEVKRTAAIDWWDGTMATRLNDSKIGHYIVVQQRIHEKDVAGHILKSLDKDYVHLNLPMEFEKGNRCKTFIGWSDPRKLDNELLWPEKFPIIEIRKLKVKLGSYRAAAQLQQRPAPKEGGIISINKFQYYKVSPARETIKRLTISIDTAYKPEQIHDYSVAGIWAEIVRGHFLLDVWREKVKYPVLKRKIKGLILKWNPNEVLIEDKASGISLIQDLKDDEEIGSRYPVKAMSPGGQDKVVRMENEDAMIEAGLVWLPESAPWLFDYENECQLFPNAENDDQVDMMSQYLKRIRQRRGFDISGIVMDQGIVGESSFVGAV